MRELRDEGVQKDLECYGFSKINKAGQMQVPADARKALGLEDGTRLMVFAERSTRRLVVTVKPLDKDLLDLATRAGVRKRTQKT